MRKTLLLLSLALAGAAFGVPAQAQIKCWNEGSKRVCGDTPPPGAKITTIRAPSGGQPAPAPAPAAESKDGAPAKDAKKGPLTPAEQEADYKKRQDEAKKAAEKAAIEKKNADAKRVNCENARRAQTQLESGARVRRYNEKGEPYFLEDQQLAQETARARQQVADACK